ncbi:RAMP superfamily CRISPR-associated protein [Inediibacterium massiliense]|uniref:RAMP superfamily CRISPR-associated protein n=1 Tax=Inediibacterium massiliense TaxID=1658111 RepID=UPI0006B3FD01|nr:RAMP superfamily CRISPR-associated protein [Inediibacterium massiliense]
MAFYIIDVENLEPLKIGASGSKANQTEATLEHIPGSTLRGAIVSRIFNKYPNLTEIEQIEILTKIKFYNLYPIDKEQQIYVPTPKNLRVDKHIWRSQKNKFEQYKKFKDIENKISCQIDNLIESKNDSLEYEKEHSTTKQPAKNNISYNFVMIGESLKGINIKKTYKLHHDTRKNRNNNTEEKDNLFRYESIDKGQMFRGFIKIEENSSCLDQKIEACFGYSENIYLGGAKTTGYGHCKFKIQKIDATSPSQFIFKNNQRELDDSRLVVLALSDCLFRDEYGQPISEIPKEEIERYFSNAKLEEVYLDIGQTEGYNSKWRARNPKEATIRAGSVWVYNIDAEEKEKFKNKIIQFESILHGDKTQEGYGWLAVNLKYPNEFVFNEMEILNSISKKTKQIDLSEARKIIEEYPSIKIILDGLGDNRKKWLQGIIKYSIDNKESSTEKDNQNKKLFIEDKSKLTQSRRRKMMEILKETEDKIMGIFNETKDKLIKENFKIESTEETKKYIDIRSYIDNNEIFSFKEKNFKKCLEYIQKEITVESEEEKVGEYIEIDQYIENQLNSIKGIHFYFKYLENNRLAKSLFLNELLYEYFYMTNRLNDGRE